MRNFPILALFLLVTARAVDAAPIPEAANRHFIRGVTAVEMASDPSGFEKALKEFEAAKLAAPTWPMPYYNMALVEERLGRFQNAATNLRTYLRLAPDASDATEVRNQIYRLEYKAENTLTPESIVEILATFATWPSRGECWRKNISLDMIRRAGPRTLRVPVSSYVDEGMRFDTLEVSGPTVTFTTRHREWSLRDRPMVRMLGSDPNVTITRITVKSRQLVTVEQSFTPANARRRGWAAQKMTCEFRKP